MKILAICSSHTLDDDRVTRKQAVSLARIGHQVTVCARRRYEYNEPRLFLVDADSNTGSKKNTVIIENEFRFSRIMRLWRLYIHARATRPDLIVAHEVETSVLAVIIKKLHKTPFVFDSHEFYAETIAALAPIFLKGVARVIALQILKWVADNAEAVTVVSPAMETFFRKISPNTPIEILYNSPIIGHFPYSEMESDPIIIVHEGTFSRARGILKIVEALKMIVGKINFRFLILGTIPGDVLKEFNAAIDLHQLRPYIDMPGRLPWTEFGRMESSGQIGLICSQPIPNHMLGLSNKLYTYMACGLAVVGMKNSETEKMLNHYNSGLAVDTTKPEEIADAILYLVENLNIRRQMARNGRQAIEKELGWHCMEERMGLLYARIEKHLGLNMTNRKPK